LRIITAVKPPNLHRTVVLNRT